MIVGQCLGADKAGRAAWLEGKTDTTLRVAVRDAAGAALLSLEVPADKTKADILAMLADYEPPAKTAKERRAERYAKEADPLLLAALGYQVEYEANPTQATLDKLVQAKADYLAAKERIRAEIQ